eukprot:SAG31_NODE_107_length_24865_cov_17.973593_11_plen_146_part_00
MQTAASVIVEFTVLPSEDYVAIDQASLDGLSPGSSIAGISIMAPVSTVAVVGATGDTVPFQSPMDRSGDQDGTSGLAVFIIIIGSLMAAALFGGVAWCALCQRRRTPKSYRRDFAGRLETRKDKAGDQDEIDEDAVAWLNSGVGA